MSCCNGNCGCGANCGCGSSCKGCGMYPDMSYAEETATTEALIVGVAPKTMYLAGSSETGENGCKCGANCQCDPCTCK